MDYIIHYSGIRHERIEPIRRGLTRLLENYYAIIGTNELLVEQGPFCVVIYPKTGEIEAVISQAGAAKKAKFESSNSSSVRFKLDRTKYVVRYKQKSD